MMDDHLLTLAMLCGSHTNGDGDAKKLIQAIFFN
jgi:hypothetical protein